MLNEQFGRWRRSRSVAGRNAAQSGYVAYQGVRGAGGARNPALAASEREPQRVPASAVGDSAVIDYAYAALAPLQRQVLEAAHSGMTIRRISETLGLPETVVREVIVWLVRHGWIMQGEATPCNSGGCAATHSSNPAGAQQALPPSCAGCPISHGANKRR